MIIVVVFYAVIILWGQRSKSQSKKNRAFFKRSTFLQRLTCGCTSLL